MLKRDSVPAALIAVRDVHNAQSKEQTPTTSFQLPHVVAGEPPTLAVERALPPAPILLPAHADDVTLGEGELVLVGLLEGEARLDQHTPTALGHVLGERKHQTDGADELEGKKYIYGKIQTLIFRERLLCMRH